MLVNETVKGNQIGIEGVARKWVELVFSTLNETDDLRLGNNKRVCKDRVVVKKSVPTSKVKTLLCTNKQLTCYVLSIAFG